MNVKIGILEFLARKDQPLKSHLTNVGAMSYDLATIGKKSIKLVGQLHDAGKARLDWLLYLKASIRKEWGNRGIVFHSIHGALILLRELGITPNSKILAGIIKSHHVPFKFVHDHDSENLSTLDECYQNVLEMLGDDLQFDIDIDFKQALRQIKNESSDVLDVWVYIKYLFSVLVDADRTDASDEKIKEEELIDFYSRYVRPSDISPDPLKDLFLEELMSELKTDLVSGNPSNLYSITAPCGLGKTNAAAVIGSYVATALKKRKIFYVGPLRSILTQNIKFFRKAFPNLYILKHLSDVTFDRDDKEDKKTEKEKQEAIKAYEKLCSNWSEAPFICTTLVQLVDTFVSSHPSKNRKLHNIENSVVIIDEVQSLPENTLPYVLLFINALAKYFNVTFILMSATQPHFTNLAKYDINNIKFKELSPNYEKFFDQRKLAHCYNMIDQIKDEASLVKLIGNYTQSKLVVLNTVKTAYRVFLATKESYNKETWRYLSSLMTEAHKERVITEITAKANSHINIVSTQCIEAGVDLDRTVVISALAPIDSLIQRLGRCFRFGITREGIFIVIDTLGSSPYDKSKLALTRKLITQDKLDLVDDQLTIINEFFGNIYSDENLNKTGIELIKLLTNSLRCLTIPGLPQKGMVNDWDLSYCLKNEYRTIPDTFYSTSVFALNSQDEYTLDNLKNISTKREMRNIGPHMATMPLIQFKENGGITLDNGINVWAGQYDEECGIIPDVTS